MQEKNLTGFKEYLLNLERSNNTIDSYITSVKLFYKDYEEISKENLIDFKKRQLEKWKPKTAHNRIVALNQFCKFLGRENCCVKNIKIHSQSSIENVITIDEYKRMIDGLKEDGNERGNFLVQYLARTGARVSEFIRLDKSGLERGYCEMWTKGKIRRIYIPKSLIEESREYFSKIQGNLLFPNRYGKPFTARGVSEDIKNWAKKYGIRAEVAHPHSFRHLYAKEFLKQNKDIVLLADLMGHSSVATTSIYLKLSKEEQIEQFNAINW